MCLTLNVSYVLIHLRLVYSFNCRLKPHTVIATHPTQPNTDCVCVDDVDRDVGNDVDDGDEDEVLLYAVDLVKSAKTICLFF